MVEMAEVAEVVVEEVEDCMNPPGLILDFQATPATPHLMDKFIGNPPTPFTGDRTKAEDFLTQWGLYCGAN
jgi:hypothetical protein